MRGTGARLRLGNPIRAQLPWEGRPLVQHQVRMLWDSGYAPLWLEGDVPPEVAAGLPEDAPVVCAEGPPGTPVFDCRRPLGAPAVDLRRPQTVPPQGWLQAWRARPGLTVFTEPIGVCPRWGTADVHAYLLVGQRAALLVDSGTGLGGIAARARAAAPDVWALHTHRDWDHVGEAGAFPWVWALARPGRIPVRTLRRGLDRPANAPWRPVEPPGRPLPPPPRRAPPSRIDLGGVLLEVHRAPGHTADGLALYDAERGDLFAGDALYAGRLFAADPQAFAATWARLLALPGLRRIWGGHGPVPATPDQVRRFGRLHGG